MTFPTIRWSKLVMAVLALAALTAAFWRSPLYGADSPVVIAAPAVDNNKAEGALQSAVLAGGCFWGRQGGLEHLRRVKNVIACYARGDKSAAHYQTLSSGTPG